MTGPIQSTYPHPEIELDDLSQEIEQPLADLERLRDEPTLTKIDFDELEIALDL